MRILSLSDKVISFIYGHPVKERFKEIDLAIGCGDLPYTYLEYVLTVLGIPLYYVRGNHDKVIEYTTYGQRTRPHGAVDLHRRVINHDGLLLAGVEGSLRYRVGKFQYSQEEMWTHVFRLMPGIISNRIRYGRYLDIFVTHAPSAGIHDKDDLPHRGIKAFRWFVKVFQPSIHVHGHIHVYRPDEVICTNFGKTLVLNTFGFKEFEIDIMSLNDHKT
jgi:uncharacterized protein